MRNLPTAPSISQIEQEGGDSGELVLIYVDPCDAVALCELFLYLTFLVLYFFGDFLSFYCFRGSISPTTDVKVVI